MIIVTSNYVAKLDDDTIGYDPTGGLFMISAPEVDWGSDVRPSFRVRNMTTSKLPVGIDGNGLLIQSPLHGHMLPGLLAYGTLLDFHFKLFEGGWVCV